MGPRHVIESKLANFSARKFQSWRRSQRKDNRQLKQTTELKIQETAIPKSRRGKTKRGNLKRWKVKEEFWEVWRRRERESRDEKRRKK